MADCSETCAPHLHLHCGACEGNCESCQDDPLTPAHLLAAAAIVAAEADERGIRHWVDLADRLTRDAALRAVPREDEDDE